MAEHSIFLLSPASCGGERAAILLRERATFDLAVKLRTPRGATVGEAFSFLSGLYFRGKLAYAQAFEDPPPRVRGTLVITTDRGLIPADTRVTATDLCAMGGQPIDAKDAKYAGPLAASAQALAKKIGRRDCDVVLLGSIATAKYVDILLAVFGERLKFPQEFVGRGDMSRGGLLLRCVRENRQLTYLPIAGATRHGSRPAKLAPVRGILKDAIEAAQPQGRRKPQMDAD
jgi:hypothetical protein